MIDKDRLSRDEIAEIRQIIAANKRKLDDDDLEPDKLTERQYEVLVMLASGCTYAEIASLCVIEHNTAKNHVADVIHKMGATNAREAVAKALVSRIITVAQIDPVLAR